ncbi:MAG TPA: PilZ domain-containing protein [Longimicrobiaceae bacterium]|nr:PilZ domain-containing protein [Longimicrobiaceae bacterium]
MVAQTSFPSEHTSASRRAFIRHPADVPIEVRTRGGATRRRERGHDVSFGGLAFTSDQRLEPGTPVEVRISGVEPAFEARARVVWCGEEDGHYAVGVQFTDSGDAFRARMVEQVCSIESYRREVREREGRTLTGEEAAREWIRKYAARFPDPGRGR